MDLGENMFGEKEFSLVLKKFDSSFHALLIDAGGLVHSNNYFAGNADIVLVRNLIESIPSIFGPYNRMIYMEEYKVIWDYKVSYHVFEKFLLELFASQYHSNAYDESDFKYSNWSQFNEFLAEHNNANKENDRYEIDKEELPF